MSKHDLKARKVQVEQLENQSGKILSGQQISYPSPLPLAQFDLVYRSYVDSIAQEISSENETTIGETGTLNNISILSNFARFNDTGSATVTGFNTFGASGKSLTLINSRAAAITLAHQNAGSTAANRMINFGNADIDLQTGQAARYQYSASLSRWVMVALLQAGGGIQSVSGGQVDNTDPINPVINLPTPTQIDNSAAGIYAVGRRSSTAGAPSEAVPAAALLPTGDTLVLRTPTGTVRVSTADDGQDAVNLDQLNSELSGYLPLAGGTLTGALNGTVADFSGQVEAAPATTAAKLVTLGQVNGLDPSSGGNEIDMSYQYWERDLDGDAVPNEVFSVSTNDSQNRITNVVMLNVGSGSVTLSFPGSSVQIGADLTVSGGERVIVRLTHIGNVFVEVIHF